MWRYSLYGKMHTVFPMRLFFLLLFSRFLPCVAAERRAHVHVLVVGYGAELSHSVLHCGVSTVTPKNARYIVKRCLLYFLLETCKIRCVEMFSL